MIFPRPLVSLIIESARAGNPPGGLSSFSSEQVKLDMSIANFHSDWIVTLPPRFTATLEGFTEWALSEEFPPQGRVSYLNGRVIIDMSPESADDHNFVKDAIYVAISSYVRRNNLGRMFMDRMLLKHIPTDLGTEPDAMFASSETIRSGRLHGEVQVAPKFGSLAIGTPDWVLEIVSPSSVRKDKIQLRRAYYEAGIPEYWIVDARGPEIEFTLLIRGESEYECVTSDESWYASPVFGCSFKLTRELDQNLLWQYTLAMRD